MSKERQESTPINNMLYFSSEIKMGDPKKIGGKKISGASRGY